MSKKQFTVVGYRHFGYDSGQAFVCHFDANDARDAANEAYAYQADCDLRDYLEPGLGVDGKAVSLSYDEALEIARNETEITAIFVGHHVDCFHLQNE